MRLLLLLHETRWALLLKLLNPQNSLILDLLLPAPPLKDKFRMDGA